MIFSNLKHFILLFYSVSAQVELNRAIFKNVGKRVNNEQQQQQTDRQSSLEREQFEPFQQHPDLNSILNTIADAASHSDDRSEFRIPTSAYLFDDERNAIDNRHAPIRHPTIHLQPSRFSNFRLDSLLDDNDAEQLSLDESKQQNFNELHKQQLLNGPKTQHVHQWSIPIDTKTNEPTEQKQQQQRQTAKSFDNNGNFMMSSPFATI